MENPQENPEEENQALPQISQIVNGYAITEADLQDPDKMTELLLKFESSYNMLEVFSAYGYSPAEEFMTLLDIIRHAEKDSTRLSALKELRSRRNEILINSGAIVKASRTGVASDGTQVTLNGAIVSKLLTDKNSDIKRNPKNGTNRKEEQSEPEDRGSQEEQENPEENSSEDPAEDPAEDSGSDTSKSFSGSDTSIASEPEAEPEPEAEDGDGPNNGTSSPEVIPPAGSYDTPEIPCIVDRPPIDAEDRRGLVQRNQG